MATVAFVSFRLGLTDGVSIAAAQWMRAFASLGWDVRTVAGEGPVDSVVPWLTMDACDGMQPEPAELVGAVGAADLVVVENLLSLPMNLPASLAVAEALQGRSTLVHHYDLPWERARFAHVSDLPVDDPAWRHVVVSQAATAELARRGIVATPIYPGFDVDVIPGDRAGTRAALGVGESEVLLLHPVRAIERKNIPGALALAESLGGTYWLTGPAEEGYGPELERLLAAATTRVLHRPAGEGGMADAYAACDAVLMPSHWEGFGNPPIEAALYRKPAVVGHYPVADELRGLGFQWLEPDDPEALMSTIRAPSVEILDMNEGLARRWCSAEAMRDQLAAVVEQPGWLT